MFIFFFLSCVIIYMVIRYMKKIFNNSYLVISIYIIFSFLIDILTNLTLSYTFSIGMILRGIFLIYLVVGLLIKYNNKENLYIIFITTLFSILFLIFNLNVYSLSLILKYDYVIFLALFLLSMYKTEDKKINRNMITISLILYSLTIIIFFLINHIFYDKSLSDTNFNKVFHAMKEVNVIITIVVPYLFISLEKRKNFIEVFAIIISLVASILIGTRLTVVIFLLSLLYLLFKKFKHEVKTKKINYTDLFIYIAFLFTFIYKFKATPLYKNLQLSLKTHKINTPWDVFTNFKLFDSFVLNNRLKYLKEVCTKVMNSNILTKIFGSGSEYGLVHMDLFDVLLSFGVILFLVFIGAFIYILKNIKTKKRPSYYPIIVIFIVAIFYGHVVLSPSVATIALVIIFNNLYKKRRKKILISSSKLEVGDQTSALFNFIKYNNNSDNEITLFLEDKNDEMVKSLPCDVIIKKHKVFKFKLRVLSKMLNILNKLKYLMTNFKEYDNSICFDTKSMSSNYLARYASNNQIIYIHNDYTYLYRSNVSKINKFFGIRKLDKYKHLIFVSNEAKDNFIALYPRFSEKAIVINNYIDKDAIISLSKEKIDINKPKNKKLFIYVGSIDEEKKNFKLMIKAISMVKEKNKNIFLWIIGSGKDEKRLKEYIKEYNMVDNVKFFGYIKNYYPYILKSDYVISTSNYEGFPILFTDAIVLDKKIITTISLSDEAIKIDKDFGYLSTKTDEDLAKTILSILQNDNLKCKKIDIDKINHNKTKLLSGILK